jgi:GT2 family glycosyltransferase
MDVSIVIVSYNTSQLLDECIVSVKKETTIDSEIIVVDNASIDDSCQMLREKHPDIKLIENENNVGFARANNQGFAIASGRYFLMLNPDTVVLDGAIDRLVNFMDENVDVGICTPRNLDEKGSLQYNCDHFPSLWINLCSYANLMNRFPKIKAFHRSRMAYWDYSDLKDVDKVMGCSLMIRSYLYKKFGGMDENYFVYFEETDLCYRVKKAGHRIVYFPFANIIHYHGESSKNDSSLLVIDKTVIAYHCRSQYYFFKKNYGIVPALLTRLLDFCYGLALIMRNMIRKNKIKRTSYLTKGKLLISESLKA